MSYGIICPFCGEEIISDVIDWMAQVDGQWECPNGHQFVLTFVKMVGRPRYPFIKLEAEKCKVIGCQNTELSDEGYCRKHQEMIENGNL